MPLLTPSMCFSIYLDQSDLIFFLQPHGHADLHLRPADVTALRRHLPPHVRKRATTFDLLAVCLGSEACSSAHTPAWRQPAAPPAATTLRLDPTRAPPQPRSAPTPCGGSIFVIGWWRRWPEWCRWHAAELERPPAIVAARFAIPGARGHGW
ncbi:unnamed protein product [Urochloa humidicola]